MTHLTSVADTCKRTSYVMIAILYTAFRNIRHVTICTTYSTLGMNTRCEQLIIWMLCFNNRSFAQFVGVVEKLNTVIVLFCSFHCCTIVPWKSEITCFFIKVILNMTLSTYQ